MEEVENGDEDEGVAGDNEEVDREEKMAEEEEEELVKQLLKQWSHTAPNHANPSFLRPPQYSDYTSLGLVSFRRDQSTKKEGSGRKFT